VSAAASSGLPVSFAALTTAACTLSGNTVTLIAAGTCTIRATQAGNANYNAATPVSRSFTVAKLSQSITFGTLANMTVVDPPFAVSATASSGLTVGFSSLTTAVCSLNANTVTLVAAGACAIRASQAGNATYAPAPDVDRSFAVTVAATGGTVQFRYDAAGNLIGIQRN
jgi:hypothetical protein